MAVSKATNDFLLLLKRSQLLQIDDLQDAAVTISQLTDPSSEEIAQVLVDDGFLTRYQADRLLKGSSRGLVIDGYKVLEVLGCGGMAAQGNCVFTCRSLMSPCAADWDSIAQSGAMGLLQQACVSRGVAMIP